VKPIDIYIAKALTLAVVIMAVQFLLCYPVVVIYSVLIAPPGQSEAFYSAAATQVITWWARIGGTAMFFFAGWLFTGRQRARNAYAFVAAMCGWYLLLELAGFAFLGEVVRLFAGAVAPWVVPQFVAGFLGVLVARRTLPANEQPIP
jgi:hypothetical protein